MSHEVVNGERQQQQQQQTLKDSCYEKWLTGERSVCLSVCDHHNSLYSQRLTVCVMLSLTNASVSIHLTFACLSIGLAAAAAVVPLTCSLSLPAQADTDLLIDTEYEKMSFIII